MTCIPMTFPRYLFVYVLRVPLPPRDVYNIILQPLNIFTDFFDIFHKQMLMYDYMDCVNYSKTSL